MGNTLGVRLPGLNTDVRVLATDVVGSFQRNGLANFASAIAFRIVLALIPFLLFLLSLLGFLHLQEVWRNDVAPEIEKNASEVAFKLIDQTVRQVLSEKRLWWLTAGLALTLWELSAATRVTMTALDRIYGLRRRRGLVEMLPRSLLLGAAMGLCLVGAIAVVRFGPLVIGDPHGILAVVSFLVRWLLAAALLGIGVALTVRFGTATRQPAPWVSLGTGLVLASWVVTSIGFGLYATYVASYTSVFGHLASVFVLLLYLWLSANAYLVGIQLDAELRERA
jgi:membrane protein